MYWVAEEANLSDLRQIILELFDLEEKAIQGWREVLKAIGEDGAILPSSEWPVQLEKMIGLASNQTGRSRNSIENPLPKQQ